MRAFVAVNLPEAERRALYDALQPLRERGLPVRWLAAGSLHLTLKFLGDVDPHTVGPLCAEIANVAAQQGPFALRLGGLGAFPRPDRPRIWWVGIDPEPRLLALHGRLEAALEPLGFPPEERPFAPHVTIGHAAGRRPARVRFAEIAAAFEFHARFDVQTIDLMESHLSPLGARYSCILAASLAAASVRSIQTAEA